MSSSSSSASPSSSSPEVSLPTSALPSTLPLSLRFNGTNWSSWKVRLLAFLRLYKLEDGLERSPKSLFKVEGQGAVGAAASESESKEDQEASASAARASAASAAASALEDNKFRDRCMKLHSILLLSLQDEPFELVMNCPVGDAHAMWVLLQDRYERKSTASKAHVWEMLFNVEMEHEESVDKYVARIKNLQVQLRGMGEEVPEGMAKHLLLKGLPSSYETVVHALGLQPSLSFEAICGHLIDHQEKVKIKTSVRGSGGVGRSAGHPSGSREAPIDVANFAGQSAGSQWRPQQRGPYPSSGGNAGANRGGGSGGACAAHGRSDNRVCFACNQPGHVAFDCSKNRDAVKCHECRRLGHTAQQCPGP